MEDEGRINGFSPSFAAIEKTKSNEGGILSPSLSAWCPQLMEFGAGGSCWHRKHRYVFLNPAGGNRLVNTACGWSFWKERHAEHLAMSNPSLIPTPKAKKNLQTLTSSINSSSWVQLVIWTEHLMGLIGFRALAFQPWFDPEHWIWFPHIHIHDPIFKSIITARNDPWEESEVLSTSKGVILSFLPPPPKKT